MPCWKQTGLQLGKHLGLAWDSAAKSCVCSTSCGVQTNSLCPECLVSSCRMCYARTKKEQSQKATGSSKEASNQSTECLGLTQFLTNTSGCHKIMWELSFFAQLRRVLRYGSQMCWSHTCSFLPAAVYINGYCNTGCETTAPPQQRHLQDMNETTLWDRGIANALNPAGLMKQSAN